MDGYIRREARYVSTLDVQTCSRKDALIEDKLLMKSVVFVLFGHVTKVRIDWIKFF